MKEMIVVCQSSTEAGNIMLMFEDPICDWGETWRVQKESFLYKNSIWVHCEAKAPLNIYRSEGKSLYEHLVIGNYSRHPIQ